MPEITTLQVSKDIAEKIKQIFPGATYEGAIQKMIEPKKSVTLPFKKAVASLRSAFEDHLVQFDGNITSTTIHFPPGCNGLVDVRVLYLDKNHEEFIIPSIEDQFLALDSATPTYPMYFPVRAKGRIRVEWNNYDGANEHIVPVQVTITSGVPGVGGL